MEIKLVFLAMNSSTCLGPLFRQNRQCSQVKLTPEEKDHFYIKTIYVCFNFLVSIIRVYNGIY